MKTALVIELALFLSVAVFGESAGIRKQAKAKFPCAGTNAFDNDLSISEGSLINTLINYGIRVGGWDIRPNNTNLNDCFMGPEKWKSNLSIKPFRTFNLKLAGNQQCLQGFSGEARGETIWGLNFGNLSKTENIAFADEYVNFGMSLDTSLTDYIDISKSFGYTWEKGYGLIQDKINQLGCDVEPHQTATIWGYESVSTIADFKLYREIPGKHGFIDCWSYTNDFIDALEKLPESLDDDDAIEMYKDFTTQFGLFALNEHIEFGVREIGMFFESNQTNVNTGIRLPPAYHEQLSDTEYRAPFARTGASTYNKDASNSRFSVYDYNEEECQDPVPMRIDFTWIGDFFPTNDKIDGAKLSTNLKNFTSQGYPWPNPEGTKTDVPYLQQKFADSFNTPPACYRVPNN